MGTVNVLTSAAFYAGQEILLNPGFRAVPGSDFLARIQACDPCALSPMERIAGTTAQPEITFIPAAARGQNGIARENPSAFEARVYPNPFNGSFTVEFELVEASEVTIQLFDITGRITQVAYRTLQLEAGVHRLPVNGAGLPAGVYECRILAGERYRQMKIVKVE